MSEQNRTQACWKATAALAVASMVAGPLAAAASVAPQIPGAIPNPTQLNGAQSSGVQNPGLQNPGTQNPSGGAGNLPGQFLGGNQGIPQGGVDEFTSIWSVPSAPKFAGFPTFPARLPGYGNYPLPVNQATGASPPGADGDSPLVLPLAPAEPEPTGWPTWIRAQAKKPLPYTTDVGLLVRQDGRVWHRDTDEAPFEPVLSYDKFASLPVGASVETRGAASFELLLHDSTRVQARGLTRLSVINLDEQTVHLAFSELSWLRLGASRRTNRFKLPDGSTIEFEAAAQPTMDLSAIFGGVAGPTNLPREPLVEIRRMDEPSWYGGRATMTNFGGADVIWTHAFGKTVIKPDHRVTLFLSPPKAPTGAGLQPGDTRVQREEEQVTCTSDMATEVQWCGAKIQLPKGAKVTFESLGGDFVEAVNTAPAPDSATDIPVTGTPGAGIPAAAKTPTGG